MEDYLLCHAAVVMPAAFACYKTDGDLKKLRGDTAYLNRVLDANIEDVYKRQDKNTMMRLNFEKIAWDFMKVLFFYEF